MLDLVRQPAQRVIAELCCLAADFGRCLAADFRDLIANRIGPALQSVGHALQCGNDGLADSVGGLRGVCGGTAAGALELALQRTQALVDVADFGGDRVGISRSRKHVFTQGQLSQWRCCRQFTLLSQVSIWRSASSLATPYCCWSRPLS